jgi:hypothetical protein
VLCFATHPSEICGHHGTYAEARREIRGAMLLHGHGHNDDTGSTADER